jgi:hypothetical protein
MVLHAQPQHHRDATVPAFCCVTQQVKQLAASQPLDSELPSLAAVDEASISIHFTRQLAARRQGVSAGVLPHNQRNSSAQLHPAAASAQQRLPPVGPAVETCKLNLQGIFVLCYGETAAAVCGNRWVCLITPVAALCSAEPAISTQVATTT